MKKTYIEPTSTIVALKVRHGILSGSDIKFNPDSQSSDSTPAPDVTYEGNALGRESLNTWEEW